MTLGWAAEERSQRGEAHRDSEPGQGGVLPEKLLGNKSKTLRPGIFVLQGTLEEIFNGCEVTLDRIGDENIQGQIRIDVPGSAKHGHFMIVFL